MLDQQVRPEKIIKILLIDIDAWKLKFINLLIPIAQEDGITLQITSTNQLSEKSIEDFDILLISEQISCNDSETLKRVISKNKYIVGISDSRESRGFFKRFKIEMFINIREHSSLKTWEKIKKFIKL